MEIRYFDKKGIWSFIAGLEKHTITKVLRTLDLLEKFGNNLVMPHSKKIGSNLFELRMRGKQEVRIFYTFHKNIIFLLFGFIKKTQKTPERLIRLAKKQSNLLDLL